MADKKIISSPPVGMTVVAATLSLNLLALALPIVILQIFDRVIPFGSYDTLSLLFIGLCVVAILEFALRWARIVVLAASGKETELLMSAHFIDRTLNADQQKFQDTTTSTHMDRFGAIAHLRGYYSGQARILSIDLPFTLVFIAMIGLIGGWLILVPLASIILLLAFRLFLKRAQTHIFEKRKILDNRRHSFLFESLSQVGTIKCNTMEPQLLRRYELLQEQTVKISHSLIHFSGFSQTFGALFSQLAVAAMGLLGAFLIIRGDIGIAELAACMLLNGRTVQPLLKALTLWAQSESLAASQTKLEEAVNVEQRPHSVNISRAIHGQISFQDVSIEHSRDSMMLLTNFSRVIEAGRFIDINGGTGNSTDQVLKSILNEVVPTTGEIRIDGRLAKSFTNSQGASGIIYVDQVPVQFTGTVIENLSAFGDGDAITRALHLSRALEVESIIHRLPLGYNTILQDNAELVNNAAILQRISLVRALVLRPKILLLNQVTETLDVSACRAFGRVMADLKGNMTVIYTGNDPVLLDLADDEITLELDTASSRDTWNADIVEPSAATLFDTTQVA